MRYFWIATIATAMTEPL